MPSWAWSVAIVSVILAYSELGGLKAIIFADAVQGLVLFSATIIIATTCVSYFGGIELMFDSIESTSPALLSTPGPSGLFTFQFLIASFLAFAMIPVTQPQMSTRLIIMRDNSSLARMAVLLSIFSFLLVLATLPIGLYGAALYPTSATGEFIANVLVYDQLPVVAAMVIVGLIAAAISTADSQLFALGSELRSGFSDFNKKSLSLMRVAIVIFALSALIVSLVSNTHIVLLARTSFAGSSLLAPMILSAVFFPKQISYAIPILTGFGLMTFLASIFGLIDNMLWGLRMDLLTFLVVSFGTIIALILNRYNLINFNKNT